MTSHLSNTLNEVENIKLSTISREIHRTCSRSEEDIDKPAPMECAEASNNNIMTIIAAAQTFGRRNREIC